MRRVLLLRLRFEKFDNGKVSVMVVGNMVAVLVFEEEDGELRGHDGDMVVGIAFWDGLLLIGLLYGSFCSSQIRIPLFYFIMSNS